MEIITLILLLGLVALLLFAIEVFVTPGFGVAGIGGTLCLIGTNVMVFLNYGNTIGLLTVAGSVVVVGLLLWWMGRARIVDRMALHSTISSTAATKAQLSIRPGDEGTAVTRLALIGNATIGGKTVEVKSADGFIDEGTPLVVTAVEEALILVRRKE